MKTLSILSAFILTTLTGFSQNICASSFKVNNGNGTCGGAGQLKLTFPGGCPVNIPIIDSVYTNGVKNNIIFAAPDNSNCGGNNGYISYCILSGNVPPANVWTIYFHNSIGGNFSCDVVNSAPNSTLPVKLLSFDAALVGNGVIARWTTENEINNNHFELERSFDGNNFTTVVIIFGAENTTNVRNAYAYTDKAASLQNKNIIYYRIKQVDKDGKYTYSYIVAVKQGSTFTQSLEVSPNPFVESLVFKFESAETGNAAIKILSITGQSMVTKNTIANKGSNSLEVGNLSGLFKGVYVAQLSINGKVVSNQKVIKN